MTTPTLKSMGIKRVWITKHGVAMTAYEYKGKFYMFRSGAIEAYEEVKNDN